jgi:hypothetical protein
MIREGVAFWTAPALPPFCWWVYIYCIETCPGNWLARSITSLDREKKLIGMQSDRNVEQAHRPKEINKTQESAEWSINRPQKQQKSGLPSLNTGCITTLFRHMERRHAIVDVAVDTSRRAVRRDDHAVHVGGTSSPPPPVHQRIRKKHSVGVSGWLVPHAVGNRVEHCIDLWAHGDSVDREAGIVWVGILFSVWARRRPVATVGISRCKIVSGCVLDCQT